MLYRVEAEHAAKNVERIDLVIAELIRAKVMDDFPVTVLFESYPHVITAEHHVDTIIAGWQRMRVLLAEVSVVYTMLANETGEA